jgi:hypothetical protein
VNKIKHNLLVQRGEGFKPLTKSNGEFIYKESDRHLASKEELSEVEIQQRKSKQDKAEKEGYSTILKMMVILVYLFITSLCFIASVKVGVFMLAVGSFYISIKLGFFILLISLLQHHKRYKSIL